ncbi:super-infection exclusion protein B [Bradyrhizobium sp. SZCCHNS2015]|uniref:super-infection exclusion protein B n=1 Tax=Bradyrhizobium sp. SZCCHNS2015 TaxID=3057305 RepID=UPI0028F04806|nr:super-infection exclusion protein B [Bradyrhizobium sp. SZCCHNS2015]
MTQPSGFPGLKDVLNAFDVSWTIAAGISITGSVLLFANVEKYPFADDLPSWFMAVVLVFVVAAYAIWLIRVLQGLSSIISRQFAGFRLRRRIRLELETLNPEERSFLAALVRENQKTFRARLIEERVATLVARGFLERAPGVFSRLDWPYFVPDVVWKEINRRTAKETLGIS